VQDQRSFPGKLFHHQRGEAVPAPERLEAALANCVQLASGSLLSRPSKRSPQWSRAIHPELAGRMAFCSSL
jgi:hypothetical protein